MIIDDKKDIASLRNNIKKCLATSSKFGMNDNSYGYISFLVRKNKKNRVDIMPVLLSSMDSSSYGGLFVPVKHCCYHPTLTNTEVYLSEIGKELSDNYQYSRSYRSQLKVFRKIVNDLTKFEIIEGESLEVNLYSKSTKPLLTITVDEEFSPRNFYSGDFGDNISKLCKIWVDKEKDDTLIKVDNEEYMESIHALLLTVGQTSLPYKELGPNEKIYIYNMLTPSNVKTITPIRLEDDKHSESIIVSASLRMEAMGIAVTIYYRYIDFWKKLVDEVEGGEMDG